MRKIVKWFLILGLFSGINLVVCSSSNIDDQRFPKAEILAKGFKYNDWFYSHQLDSLIQNIADKNYSLKELRDFRKKVDQQLGQELQLVNEQFGIFRENVFIYTYIRYSQFSKVDKLVKTTFGFDRFNKINSFSVETLQPEAPTKYLNYQTKTQLRLPFDGEWYVGAGGRTLNLNHHTITEDQRFAYDFIIKHDGYSFKTDGRKNEDYYCYDKEILAPGSGTIVEVKNDLRENKIGDMPKTSGNHVVIDHSNGEYSLLSHFKYKTIVVKPGQKVEIGQFLGLCGNSGHSSEPHLHYHLQNTPVFFKGEGLPAQFQNYIADGKVIERGEPVWDQRVKNIND